MSPPAWDELSRTDALRAAVEERTQQEAGYGPPNYKMALRLFDEPLGTKPRVTFYHDHNVWCPFCETLWLYLEEKRIPYKAVTVNKELFGKEGASTPEEHAYWRMGARGVPGFQIDGGRLHSGADLLAIEAVFHDHNPLVPDDDDPAVDRWATMARLKEGFGAFWGLNKADVKGRVVDSEPYKQFVAAADALNSALGGHGGPYLTGDKLSILDIEFARSAERAAAMLPYFKGLQVRRNPRWPHLERWYVAMESRPAYRRIAGDHYTHVSATPLQVPFLVGPKHADGAAFAAAIDGSDGSWSLPLPKDDGTLLEPLTALGASDEEARCEAAERVVHNHRALAGFAARGLHDAHAKELGSRDQTYASKYGKAIPPLQSGAEVGTTNLGARYGGSDELVAPPEVTADVLLRYTVGALLHGPTVDLKQAIANEKLPVDVTKESMSYLRDRISVPRDMSGPAARQLRAHLNWVVGAVEGAAVFTVPTTHHKQANGM